MSKNEETPMPEHSPTDDPRFNAAMRDLIVVGHEAGGYRVIVAFMAFSEKGEMKIGLSSNVGEGLPLALMMLAREGTEMVAGGAGDFTAEHRSLDPDDPDSDLNRMKAN
jgi:Ni,Fe-hydrogenase maturation factor